MTVEGESVDRRKELGERIASLSQQAWIRARILAYRGVTLGLVLFHALTRWVELAKLTRRANTLESEVHAHSDVLGQIVLRLHREAGDQSTFESFGDIKAEIEAITRRQDKLKKIAVEIAELRSNL